jgi:hypothetical protein
MDKVRLYPSWLDIENLSSTRQNDIIEMVTSGSTVLPASFISHDTTGHVSSEEAKWSHHLRKENHEDGTYTLDNGKIIDVFTIPEINTTLTENFSTLCNAKKLVKKYPDILQCGGKLPIKVIGGKNTLIPFIIQEVMSKNNIHVQKVYDIVKVGTNYRIYTQGVSNPSWDTMGSHCNTENVKSIIRQLAAMCFSMKQNGFSHGYPVLQNLCFHYEACSYVVSNHHIDGLFTLKYKAFENSSATFNGNHYFINTAKTRAFQSYVEENPFELISNDANGVCEKRCDGKSLTYKLNSQTSEIYEVIRHGGIAMYSSSYDFYSFFVELMMQDNFREVVFSDPHLRSVWNNIWIDERSMFIMNDRVTMKNKNEFLVGVNLRCDIAEHVLYLTD